MEKVVLTPRLKLTLLESLEEGSDDLKYVHAVRSNEVATQWSILGATKSLAETQKVMEGMLPSQKGEWTQYQVAYAVHRLIEDSEAGITNSTTASLREESEIIGLVTLKPEKGVPISDELTIRTDPSTGMLRLEIGYLFLPNAWGRGYASETCTAVLEACRRSRPYFAPFTRLSVEAVVSPDNPASMKVLENAGMKQIGLNEWDEPPVFLAGAWREGRVWIYRAEVFGQQQQEQQ